MREMHMDRPREIEGVPGEYTVDPKRNPIVK